MSVRENIQVFHQVDIHQYLIILEMEYQARKHPNQPGGFLVGNPELPFYKPQWIEDHMSVMGFNDVPLSILLIQALIDHPDLAPANALVRWTQEQELILEEKLGDLRKSLNNYEEGT